MRHFFLILLCVSVTRSGLCQVNEWLDQKRTQTRYLVEQISGLRAYAAVVRKGYQSAKDGLSLIDQIKKGDFELHAAYQGSLLKVREGVKRLSPVEGTLLSYRSLMQSCETCLRFSLSAKGIVPAEKQYIARVVRGVEREAGSLLGEVSDLLQASSLSLKDDERMRRLALAFEEMQEAEAFIRGLERKVKLLVLSRERDAREIKALRKMYGIGE